MADNSTAGRTECTWANPTMATVFKPLLNYDNSFNEVYISHDLRMLIVSNEDTTLQYPGRFRELAPRVTSPKPDAIYGCYVNQESIEVNLLQSSTTRFDWQTLSDAGFTAQNIMDVSCGLLQAHLFAFPTVLIERKSDNASLFVGQNQILGGLTCIIESLQVVKNILGEELDAPAIALMNYGNYVEFWLGFEAEVCLS
jgi:hypothetical protein